MLYIWPFFAFFSLPLLLPYAVNILLAISEAAGLVQREAHPSHLPTKQAKTVSKGNKDTTKAPSLQLKLVCSIFESKIILWLAYISTTLILTFGVVKYNTIIHPFTLADNRHYMFYIFRYSIRRAAWIRYFLILPYTLSRWLVWGTIAGSWNWFFGGEQNLDDDAPFSNHTFRHSPVKTLSKSTSTTRATGKKRDATVNQESSQSSDHCIPTSTALIFLLATTLSLITAPLVEPRYFIIPWVMWRLMVPSWQPSTQSQRPTARNGVMKWCQGYDARLWVETVWFLTINAATGYVFLCKPYLWTAEDGTVLEDGRLQRFMW
jgi:alpha-1,2-glucosyltransferase